MWSKCREHTVWAPVSRALPEGALNAVLLGRDASNARERALRSLVQSTAKPQVVKRLAALGDSYVKGLVFDGSLSCPTSGSAAEDPRIKNQVGALIHMSDGLRHRHSELALLLVGGSVLGIVNLGPNFLLEPIGHRYTHIIVFGNYLHQSVKRTLQRDLVEIFP
jgi:hypothetical protein